MKQSRGGERRVPASRGLTALLSQTDKTGLMHLASSATPLSAYIIQVRGFADVPGDNAYDQQLSRDRAEAVIDYLEKTGRVPITHIVAPGVLGAQAPAATNEPLEAIRRTGARRSSCCSLRRQPVTDLDSQIWIPRSGSPGTRING
jgi:integrase